MLITVMLVGLLVGCAERATSIYAGLSVNARRELAGALAEQRRAELDADLQEAFALRPCRHVLLLSGGDAHGAFGAGVLAAWRENASLPRPEFDVVTGVSTGALMATFAFLNTPADDALLGELYTNLRDQNVFEGLWVPGPVNGLVYTTPLKKLIAKYVTPEVLARVAAEHRRGRRLYAATVDLDSGNTRLWPLSRIATEPGGLERFRKVLLASAAIPLFFPPVEIDGELHVDAGLREFVVLRKEMLGPDTAAAQATALRTGDGPEDVPTVYALVNGKLRSPPQAVENDLAGIGQRSLNLYTEALQILSLRDAAHLAAAHRPAFVFKYLAEPDDLDIPGATDTTPNPLGKIFDPKVTRQLYEAGKARGGRRGVGGRGW